MFSLEQINYRATVLRRSAEDLRDKADTYTHTGTQISLRCYADGLTTAADMLEAMMADEVEREAREAMR